MIEGNGLWAGVSCLISRLRQIGVKSLKESLKRKRLGILVLVESKKSKMPSYQLIYDLGVHFGKLFKPARRLQNMVLLACLIIQSTPTW